MARLADGAAFEVGRAASLDAARRIAHDALRAIAHAEAEDYLYLVANRAVSPGEVVAIDVQRPG